MAFTAAQKTLANELLGLFEGGTYQWFQYVDDKTGENTGVPWTEQISFAVANTAVTASFTAIEAAGDDRENRIGTILSEYDDISLDVMFIKGGGVAGVSGLRYDFRMKIARLKSLLEFHLGIQIRLASGTGPISDGGGRNIRVGRY